ncbi:hypothetical protein L0663_05125 [Dyadobacter sp. CY107]|uniref:hypothetical protein n=1 Tax=Dyadobacter fanqingshengii TaxID=2906443 RepID=UPI001F426793|nr:hypothetical protein [Dyadobacter fanqingshengii]MCF2502749.1 hypothetical protein [Dyadobacter fanqingshengii]
MKLTKAQIKVVEKAKQQPFVETMETDGIKTYRFMDGENVRSDLFSRLLVAGFVIPQNDGLFSGFSRTYVAKPD